MNDPVDDLKRARKRLDRAEKAVKAARAHLGDRAAAALEAGTPKKVVVRESRYTAEHVRRLVRARGIAPGRAATVRSLRDG